MRNCLLLFVLFTVLNCSHAFAQPAHVKKAWLKDYRELREKFKRPPSGGTHFSPPTYLYFRTLDGTYNNLVFISQGSAGKNLRRIADSQYLDSASFPAGDNRNSARLISNICADQGVSIPNDRDLSAMVWQWGQFLDHDIDLTVGADPAEAYPIAIPTGDTSFDPGGFGLAEMEFFRSKYDLDTGITSPREQVNDITAWVDGSNVYGSDDATAASLRSFSGGRMNTSAGDLLPIGNDGFFMAGDVRANEQSGLTCIHTLFVREHNRIADRISTNKPHLTDEQVYLRARREVIGILQAITYNEFIPALLGQNALQPYSGYQPWKSPEITNEFSTAAYRFGHSMLNAELLRLDNDGNPIPDGHLALRDAFFNPQQILGYGIDVYLKGLVHQESQEVDLKLIDDVRNFLFGPPGSGGFDLAALNIQRGRDHGLADYNTIRQAVGLPSATDYSDITSDPAMQLALSTAYDSVDDMDAWVVMLAEDHVPGSSVGPTVRRILRRQFRNLRDADRFWYQRNFSGPARFRIHNTTLADVILRNTGVTGIPDNVFFVED